MDGANSLGSTFESTDSTSQLMRHLNALNLDRSAESSNASILGDLNATDNGSGIPGSGDGSHNPTMSQLMRTQMPHTKQEVSLLGDDFSHCVFATAVNVRVSPPDVSSSIPGSNKVKTTPIVNFDWPAQYYYGNVVAVHPRNIYLFAFALKGKTGGNIRVMHRKTTHRCLLKGFQGKLLDVSFAHSRDFYVAGIDEFGNTLVFSLELNGDQDDKIVETLVLRIQPRPECQSTAPRLVARVLWCPYVPDDADDGSDSSFDASHLLAVLYAKMTEVWAVDVVAAKYGSGPVDASRKPDGFTDVGEQSNEVVDAAFAPDGTALATACLNGEVIFFQIYMNEQDPPRRLHKWKPHDGKPLSCLFFLDNHKTETPDSQFWRYAVTGANRNQELKIWSCVNWNCFQTLRFKTEPGLDLLNCNLKATLDLTAQYLVLCDSTNRMLYVLQVFQNPSTNAAHFSSLSEFRLAKPCYSLAILEGINRRRVCTPGEDHLEDITTGELDLDMEDVAEEGDVDNSGDKKSRIQIRLIAVQSKALQEMLITYEAQSSAAHPTTSVSSLSTDRDLRDGLTDVSMSAAGDSGPDSSFSLLDNAMGPDGDRLASLTSSQTVGESASLGNRLDRDKSPSPVLLTPDDFRRNPRDSGGILPNGASGASVGSSMPAGLRGSGSSTSSFTAVTALQEDSYISPRSSGDPSILSPGSSTVLPTPSGTPSSAVRRLPTQDTTPTSVPLPPITSQEEEELITSRSSGTSSQRSGQSTPPGAKAKSAGGFFYSQSAGDAEVSGGTVEEETQPLQPTPRRSQRSSDGQEAYDDDDAEVAEVLGEQMYNSSGKLSGTGEFQQQEEGGEEEEEEVEEEEGAEGEDEEEEGGGPLSSAWPPPPTLDHNDHFQSPRREDLDESEFEALDHDDDDDNDDDAAEEGDDNEDDIAEDLVDDEERARTKVNAAEETSGKAFSELASMMRSMQEALAEQGQAMAAMSLQLMQQQEATETVVRRLQEVSATQEQLLQAPLAQQSSAQGEDQAHASLLPRIETLLATRMHGETQRVQSELARVQNLTRQELERLQNVLGQTVTTRVNSAVSSSVRAEMKNLLAPAVNECLAPLRERMGQDLQRSLQANEGVLRDSVNKMVRNRQTMEAIGSAVSSAVPLPMQTAFSEVFQTQVIPAFQQATTNMFQQMNECFQRGTKEYQTSMEKHLERMRQQQQATRDPQLSHILSSLEALRSSTESLQQSLGVALRSDLKQQLQTSMAALQADVVRQVRGIVREETSAAVREQEASIRGQLASIARSNAATPVPTASDPVAVLAQVKSLARQGSIVEAYQLALNAANLDVVVALCETVTTAQVFSGRQPITLPIILSLMHQLCSRLTVKTEIKLQYLEEAVMSLQQQERAAEEHVPEEHVKKCLHHVTTQLRHYIANNPSEAKQFLRSARMIIALAESI